MKDGTKDTDLNYKEFLEYMLTKYKNKTKMSFIAELYKKQFGEHITHNWHTS